MDSYPDDQNSMSIIFYAFINEFCCVVGVISVNFWKMTLYSIHLPTNSSSSEKEQIRKEYIALNITNPKKQTKNISMFVATDNLLTRQQLQP